MDSTTRNLDGFLTPPAGLRGAGRFAPTPTGRLHLGNARTALLAWLDARKAGLRTVLRVEDLDVAAMPAGCLAGQLADLAWLGLRFDEGPETGGPVGPYRQSERFDLYARALEALNARGLLYACGCTRREVHDAARAPHANDEGPVYARTCAPARPQSLPDLAHLPERDGRQPALRLDVAAALAQLGRNDLSFNDLAAGPQSPDVVGALGDFVVQRRDGIAAYQLACAVDDAAMGCTRVVRGADLLPSAARQILLLESLALPVPVYAHVGLVLDATGARLAKRDEAISLAGLRTAGVAPEAVLRALARCSGLPETADLDALVAAYHPGLLTATAVILPAD